MVAARAPPATALGGVASALAAAAVALVIVLSGVGADNPTLEFRAQLQQPGRPAVTADAKGLRLGVGRAIEFRTDNLPILPKGQYYELWFVGPGDSPANPNRISAGTFHPDQRGRSDVRFAAAVDPKKYPVLSVTAEPADGDPQPSRKKVLRSRAIR